MNLELSINGTSGSDPDFDSLLAAIVANFLSNSAVTDENPPFRLLVLSIPGYQAKPTLAAFVCKQPGVKMCWSEPDT